MTPPAKTHTISLTDQRLQSLEDTVRANAERTAKCEERLNQIVGETGETGLMNKMASAQEKQGKDIADLKADIAVIKEKVSDSPNIRNQFYKIAGVAAGILGLVTILGTIATIGMFVLRIMGKW